MFRKILFLTFVLWFFWFLLNTSFTLSNNIIGLIAAFGISSLTYFLVGEYITPLDLNYKKILFLSKYLLESWQEIIKANIDVAERVLDPKLPINPSIIKIEVPQQDNIILFTLLANTITLTPGTLSLDSDKNHIYVHFLAEEYIESLINRNLAQQLKDAFDEKKNKGK